MLSMIEAKALAQKDLKAAAGQQFETPKGVIGTVLGELSARGKIQAELTCSEVLEDGSTCQEVHIREISDWHQSDKCRTHRKSKTRSSGIGVQSTGHRPMKILDTDPEDVRRQKEEFNAVLEQVQAAEKAAKAEQRAKEAEARKAKQAEERAKKEAEKIQKSKAALAANLEKVKALAKERGVAVSAKTLAAAGE